MDLRLFVRSVVPARMGSFRILPGGWIGIRIVRGINGDDVSSKMRSRLISSRLGRCSPNSKQARLKRLPFPF